MKSKHHGWQKRWAIDQAAGTFTHACGLQVQFDGPDDTRGRADNAAQLQAALAVKNGHNAAAMVARMLREAADLRRHGTAARINTTSHTPSPRTSNWNPLPRISN